MGLGKFPSPFAVFRYRNFSLIWTGQLVSTIGSALTSLAASILVYRATNGSALSVGLMLMASTLNLNVLNSDMDKGYRLGLYLVNAGSQQVSLLDGKISPAGKDYVFATSLGWIP